MKKVGGGGWWGVLPLSGGYLFLYSETFIITCFIYQGRVVGFTLILPVTLIYRKSSIEPLGG